MPQKRVVSVCLGGKTKRRPGVREGFFCCGNSRDNDRAGEMDEEGEEGKEALIGARREGER